MAKLKWIVEVVKLKNSTLKALGTIYEVLRMTETSLEKTIGGKNGDFKMQTHYITKTIVSYVETFTKWKWSCDKTTRVFVTVCDER